MRITRTSILISLIILLGVIAVIHAQDDSACSELVEEALETVADNCEGLDRNQACYGYNLVEATFGDVDQDAQFLEPSDRADLLHLETLYTTPLDEANDTWGVAVMSVQADLPNTLPGQNVIFMLLGDVEIENAVAPDEAFIPADPITITTAVSASNIRVSPNTSALVLGSVALGTEFEADARSADGEWLRVIFDGQPAWINQILINRADGLETLPIINTDQKTPMQAFVFRTGIGDTGCEEAPNSLLVQGPEEIEVNITANGVDIEIGSTILLETATGEDDEEMMQVTSVSGSAIVDGVVIPGGFTVSTQLGEDGQVVSGSVSGFRPINGGELNRLQTLRRIRATVLNYEIVPPSFGDIIRLQQAVQSREEAAQACQSEGLTRDQCREVLGADRDDLATRYQRCLDRGYDEALCRRIVSGRLNPTIVFRCLAAGYRTEEECREAYQEATSTTTLEDYCRASGATTQEECRSLCESQGYDTIEECTAAVEEATSTDTTDTSALQQVCAANGATTPQECRALCESQGYTTLEECAAAAEELLSRQTSSDSTTSSDSSGDTTTSSSPTLREICEARGYTTPRQCAQWCRSMGYSTIEECRAAVEG